MANTMCLVHRMRLPIWVAVLVSLSTVATAQCITEPLPVITHHQIRVSGKLLSYTAEVGRIAIRDVETGEPHGYMFYTAYRVPSSRPRPLTFIWNGGPGADSSLLHFFVAGPRRVKDGKLVDNPDTWLTASDLVMVDPIGTGFSRPTKSKYGPEFYGTVGDVASVTEFIRSWRLLHDAEKAPLFLIGESWGARRAANVAYALEKRGIPVNGMVLISGGWGLNEQYVSQQETQALRVVDMASAALYYGKGARNFGQDAQSVRQAAEEWVHNTYAPALNRVDSLNESERNAIVAQLSQITGLAEAQIDRKTLIITPHQFRTDLLKNEHKQLYIFDLRRTAPPTGSGSEAILDYFRHTLGYSTSLPYIGLEDIHQGFAPTGVYPEPVNEQWNYATAKVTPDELKAAIETAAKRGDGPPKIGPSLPATEDAVAINPRMKILVAAGMYDSFLPCAEGQEIERRLPPNLHQSLTFKCYVGGHAMYQDARARTELSNDVKSLIEHAR